LREPAGGRGQVFAGYEKGRHPYLHTSRQPIEIIAQNLLNLQL